VCSLKRGVRGGLSRHDSKTERASSIPTGNDQAAPDHRSGGQPESSEDAISQQDLLAILLAKHNELDRLLNELQEISGALQSKASPDIQDLSESLMKALRGAVRQSLLDKQLCTLALLDDLTGLHNRRGFLALAGQQLKQAHRNAQELLLFSVDVDNLKQINDSYGHQKGDTALVQTAQALRRTFRNSDILARFGGDEFLALALEASVQNEQLIIDRLHENLKRANGAESRHFLSASIGIARFDPRLPATLEQLMERADQAMYEVKRSRPRRPSVVRVSG
jgi:diguanylate cyclase (GGDEF)-like protein